MKDNATFTERLNPSAKPDVVRKNIFVLSIITISATFLSRQIHTIYDFRNAFPFTLLPEKSSFLFIYYNLFTPYGSKFIGLLCIAVVCLFCRCALDWLFNLRMLWLQTTKININVSPTRKELYDGIQLTKKLITSIEKKDYQKLLSIKKHVIDSIQHLGKITSFTPSIEAATSIYRNLISLPDEENIFSNEIFNSKFSDMKKNTITIHKKLKENYGHHTVTFETKAYNLTISQLSLTFTLALAALTINLSKTHGYYLFSKIIETQTLFIF